MKLLFFWFNARLNKNVMRHLISKRKKTDLEGVLGAKGEMIRRWGFASLYGLLRAS